MTLLGPTLKPYIPPAQQERHRGAATIRAPAMDDATQKRWEAWADARIRKCFNQLLGDLAEPIGKAIAQAEHRIREKHSAEVAELRRQNAQLLTRILAIEARETPTEGTVIDMRAALKRGVA